MSSPPKDWKVYHTEQLSKVHPEKVAAAVEFLCGYFSDAPSTVQQIRTAHNANPQTWWAEYHLTWGMAVRNLLRRNGYGEKDLGISNLDNIYVGLVERMLYENKDS